MLPEMQPTEKQDLRVIRTHKMIRQALINLLKEKEFEQIAVQDIVELAMVNRATFYKYYSGKSDLAGKMIADFKATYQTVLTERFSGEKDVQTLMNTAFPILYEQREMILALWKIETKRHHLYRDMHNLIKRSFIAYAQTRTGRQDFDFQGEMLASLLLASAKYHFEQGRGYEPKKIIGEFKEMMRLIEW
ncbi:TetR/AcrR family transcriptional regulator [Necropsobacter massiliensis]|uniref:TetR/AcrR family transcriptional regulator n=1 Tax=Necropsobacter massiliensis TaxID=1400001 RepID=UPI0007751BEF|nr:TetR family transcriptional regulator [Necropsobacter massiliensis]